MSYPTKLIKIITPIALAISLAACGGESSFGSAGTTAGSTGNSTDNGGTGTEEPIVLSMGAMKIGLTSLSAGGSTGITVELKDQNGDYAKTEQTVTFSSTCISNGTSEIVNPVTSSTGVFTTTYTAKGCEGNDIVKAEVGSLESVGTINVLPANLGAVEFISAEPKNILLKGMSAAGQQHTSTVTFQIKNDVGGPIANEDVNFALVTPSSGDGGITLSSVVGKTNNDGFVSTILQAGTVHTTVRVRATVTRGGTTIESESSALSISTGVADQNSLSISVSKHNPAAWDYDGVEVDVTVRASDRYNSPVPDGTAVSFYTELGQMNPASCEIKDGACTVKWISQSPRDLGTNDIRYPHEGITTITAKVIGEESFLDSNANGIFDDGDIFDTFSDKGEAYADYNMNYGFDRDLDGSIDVYTDNKGRVHIQNAYDDGLDRFILDYNGNGVYDPKDGKYTGLGCAHSTLCAADNGLKDIYTSIEIVLSEVNLVLKVWGTDANGNPTVPVNVIHNDVNYLVEVSGVTNNQVPPVGTAINASSEEAKVVIGSTNVPSTNSHYSDVSAPRGGFFMPLRVKDKDPGLVENGDIKITASINLVASSVFLTYIDD